MTDDEIREKYLERAIRELNTLTRDLQACPHCPRGNLMPVLGSGHPQADIMLLKHAALPSEIEVGVAFYGRAGSALMKSLKRLQIAREGVQLSDRPLEVLLSDLVIGYGHRPRGI